MKKIKLIIKAIAKSVKSKYNYYLQFCNKVCFEDRSKNSDKLCIVLSGYKEFLYDDIFYRLKKFATDDIDICICSSGKYSKELSNLCKLNNWSYLSTKRNNICLIQNIAISKFNNAKYIFKLDEDIFITKNYFSKMLKAYEHSKKERYNIGIIAPLIPVNGYGYVRILEKTNNVEYFEKQYEKVIYTTGWERKIEKDINAVKFLWGNVEEKNYNNKNIINIDDLNEKFGKGRLCEKPCCIRFSIGAIMFEKNL